MKYQLQSTAYFDKWLKKIKDKKTRSRILFRFDTLCAGNFGDYKQLAPNLYELRFFFGAGLRIYCTIQQERIVLLLVGGDKSSQGKDIAKAKEMIEKMEE